MSAIELLAVIEVPETRPVLCQAEQCGRSVYRSVHIVREGNDFRIYGSECAKKLLGVANPRGRSDRTSCFTGDLSERDVDLLKANTAALLEELRQRHKETQPKSNEEIDPRTLSRPQLEAYCLAIVKERFRKEKGVNPDQPGWAGWIKREASELASEILATNK